MLQLQERGVNIAPIDYAGSEDDITAQLRGIDVVISCFMMNEVILANAAKKAGVKRFVPCFYATVMPRGIMSLRDDVCPPVCLLAGAHDLRMKD